MTFDELDKLVKESLWEMAKADVTASRIVISNRLKAVCMEEYDKYCIGEPTTYYGVPLEFADLPDNLYFYIESEVRWRE